MPETHKVPKYSTFEIDDITADVIRLVKEEFDDHFGDIDNFHFAVTRKGALSVLNTIEERLLNFGQYQDAMVEGKPGFTTLI